MMKLKKPFHMIIVGTTATRKTHFLLDLLEREHKGYFNRIYLICSTYHMNKVQKEWAYQNDENFIIPSMHPLPCGTSPGHRHRGQHAHGRSRRCKQKLAHPCRLCKLVDRQEQNGCTYHVRLWHDGLPSIVITQQFTSSAKTWRDNLCKLVFFYNPNKKDVQTMFNDFLGFFPAREKQTF